MSYKLEIEIATQATDANKTSRGNKLAHNKTKQKIKNHIAILVRGKEPPIPLVNFKVSVVRHGPRAMDYDNLISSIKAHLDGLVISKVIKNDSWRYIKSIFTNQVISEERKLVISVWEAYE